MLVRPTLMSVPAFDATNEQVFTFVALGGSQFNSVTLTIRHNNTNEIVYTHTTEQLGNSVTLPAGTLTNGEYYNATIQTHTPDEDSEESEPITFWCYTTPAVTITNLPASGTVGAGSYRFEAMYNQVQGELMQTYIFNLYNARKVLFDSSGLQYPDSTTLPIRSAYTFNGFENNGLYYIEYKITTVNGTEVSTGLMEFTVQYIKPDIFTLLELTNNCKEGYVVIRSNVTHIEGVTNPDPAVYTDDGKAIDVTGEGNYVEWNENFVINGNILTRAWFRKPKVPGRLLTMKNADTGENLTVDLYYGYENPGDEEMKLYALLTVTGLSGLHYIIFSNFIEPLDDETYCNLWLTREDNVYQLQIAPKED